jgi:hypothetical protein
MKEFIRLGTQFVEYRDYAKKTEGIILLLLLVNDLTITCYHDLDCC